jgi:hypothetical protein
MRIIGVKSIPPKLIGRNRRMRLNTGSVAS